VKSPSFSFVTLLFLTNVENHGRMASNLEANREELRARSCWTPFGLAIVDWKLFPWMMSSPDSFSRRSRRHTGAIGVGGAACGESSLTVGRWPPRQYCRGMAPPLNYCVRTHLRAFHPSDDGDSWSGSPWTSPPRARGLISPRHW
jgi:hypothetical protein